MNIKEFSKGDVITRVEASDPFGIDIHPLTGEAVVRRDRSYIGDKLIFFGLGNGRAYFHRTNRFETEALGKETSIPVDKYSEGWEYWIDPKTIYDGAESFTNREGDWTEAKLQKHIDIAISCDNFEQAAKLRDKMHKLFGS